MPSVTRANETRKERIQKKELVINKRVHKLRARAFYDLLKENNANLLILSFDCQKNQPMPKIPDQITYYSRQLYIYNFTVVVGHSKTGLKKENVYSYTWTEDILPKASNEIASAVFHCLCQLKNMNKQINPDPAPLFIKVKDKKLSDVKTLLTTHYGENWEELSDLNLKLFKEVLSRPDSLQHEYEHENCEPMQEVPHLIV
ncbi:unnamed protein product [Pieris macdunnoughi]|uniref:Uncharacterized protein n=1 Tax=Pieris macdunnoughi TaxID=345717 RepID=A0A821XPP6_9NEOP|nr:unnamed protein product [Pieris macdunnoughi]